MERAIVDLIRKLQNTKSRSKRKLLDEAAYMIDHLHSLNELQRMAICKLEKDLRAKDVQVQKVDEQFPELDCVLDKGALMPTRAHEDDAGLDLYSRSMAIVEAGDSRYFDTGVHIAIPEGYVGMVKAKSGLNTKHGITCTGVIDAGYTGGIGVMLYNHSHDNLIVDPGMKIAQLVILPIITPGLRIINGQLAESDRGDSGFGSTGKF